MNTDNNHPSHPSGEQPLESWKEIASYLQRDARTVARWEKEEGLPVHRLRHHRRATVYAYPSELEQWKTDRKPGDSSDPTPRTWTRTTWGVAATALMGIALWAVARGPILNPPGAHVEAARNDGVTVRRLWSGETDKPLVLGDANGKTSIYADYDTGELMVLNLETGEKQKHPEVTSWSSGTCDSLKLAPSGLQAACSWWHPGTGKYELRILSLDGGETRTLLSYAEGQAVRPYDWSRDGKQLLVTVIRSDATIQIGIVSVPEATLRIVKSLEWRRPRNLSFSPDGQYIAYDAPLDPRSQNRDIFSLAVDGSSETPMVEHLSADYSPYWTPDGNGILFFSDRNDEQSAWLQPIEKGRPLGSPRLVRKDTQQIYPLGFDRSGVFYWGQFTDESGLYLADVDFEKGQFVSEPRHLRLRLGRSINDIRFGQPTGSSSITRLLWAPGRRTKRLWLSARWKQRRKEPSTPTSGIY